MIDQNKIGYRLVGPVITAEEGSIYGTQDEILLRDNMTFTRSDGTIISRIYERLTKASRRRENPTVVEGADVIDPLEQAYRQGLYDAYKALQEELKFSD